MVQFCSHPPLLTLQDVFLAAWRKNKPTKKAERFEMDLQSTMATMQVYLKSPSLTSNTCVLLVQMKPRELINQKNTYGDSKENV